MFHGVVKPMFTLRRETFIQKGERIEDISSVPPMGYTHTVMSDNQLNRGTLLLH